MSGKFIVIEGLEGAGKSTAVAVVERFLHKVGIEVIEKTREPGGTEIAEKIRSLVKETHQEPLADKTELLLMYAARTQLIETIIKPSLAKGAWVIGDRHDLSSQAYQGGGRGIDATTMLALRDIALDGFKPHLTLYLDIDPKLGLERAKSRGELDRIELMALPFFERTRETYLGFVANDPTIKCIDASQSIESVTAQIETVLHQWFDALPMA